jgi:hypothetical protein
MWIQDPDGIPIVLVEVPPATGRSRQPAAAVGADLVPDKSAILA